MPTPFISQRHTVSFLVSSIASLRAPYETTRHTMQQAVTIKRFTSHSVDHRVTHAGALYLSRLITSNDYHYKVVQRNITVGITEHQIV